MKKRGAITEHGFGWLVIMIPIVLSSFFLGLLVVKILDVTLERDESTPGINDFETLIAEIKDLSDDEIITIPIEDQQYRLSGHPGKTAPVNCKDITCFCLDVEKCERFPKFDAKEHSITVEPIDNKNPESILTSITVCRKDKIIAIGKDEKECRSNLII